MLLSGSKKGRKPLGKRLKIGLALGGGAARALSHIGVIEALIAHDIPIDVVAGTSMGAIIGALYAIDPDIGRVREKLLAYLASDVFAQGRLDFIRDRDLLEGEGLYYRFTRLARRGLFYTSTLARGSFISEATVEENFATLVDDIDISSTRIPFAAAATDLTGGQECVLDRGNLRRALAASCAIPGILPPVPWGEMQLVDGGWIDAVPIEPALHLGADLVIAVDVARDISELEHGRRALDIIFRADTISRYALAREKLARADIVLRPAVQTLHWADFTHPEKAIACGRESVEARLEEINRLLRSRRLRAWLRPPW